jgi:hypothetical protein
MNGIYLTEEGKKEIEKKINQLESTINLTGWVSARIETFKQILVSATILPVEESWENVELYPPDNESQFEKTMSLKNGVIIKSKKL